MKHFATLAAIALGLCTALAVSWGDLCLAADTAAHTPAHRPSYRIQSHRNSVGTPRKIDANRENRILVILAQYTDQSFFYDSTHFKNMLTLPSYSLEGASGCAKEYLDAQFGASFQIDVAGVVRVSQTRHFYGVNNSLGYDTHPATFAAEACMAADSLLGVNFADYDCDKDGYVDNLFVFYAGEDEAQQATVSGVRQNSDYMWSHSSTLSGGDYGEALELDGVKIDRYACTSEIYLRYSSSGEAKSYMAPVGTFLHELMHTFGLTDMYDTDYELSGGTAAGLWRTTCIMDAGNYNNNGNTPPNLNSLERKRLGLISYTELQEGKHFIYPVGDSAATAYRISNKADSSEYYVLECRYPTGWDKCIGGSGLLLYRVDESKDRKTTSETYGEISSLDRWNTYNEVNARPDHQCADLVEADSRSDLNPSSSSLADIASIFFPQTSSKAIGGSSGIPLSFWDGSESSMYIYNITDCGEGTVSFYVRDSSSPVPPIPDTPPEDTDMLYIIAQSDSVKYILSVNNQVGATVAWTFDGKAIENPLDFRPAASGTVKAVISWPDGSEDVLYKKIVK